VCVYLGWFADMSAFDTKHMYVCVRVLVCCSVTISHV